MKQILPLRGPSARHSGLFFFFCMLLLLCGKQDDCSSASAQDKVPEQQRHPWINSDFLTDPASLRESLAEVTFWNRTAERDVTIAVEGQNLMVNARTTARIQRRDQSGFEIDFSNVRNIVAGNRTIDVLPLDQSGRCLLVDSRRYADQLKNRLANQGIQVWESGNSEEVSEVVANQRDYCKPLSEFYFRSKATVRETEEVLLLTNAPADAVDAALLDLRQGLSCTRSLLRVTADKLPWHGKCVVVLFDSLPAYRSFVTRMFMHPEGATFSNGMTTLFHDGSVVVACFVGSGPAFDASQLSHEIAHACVARHLTSAPLPQWLEEGIAEWVRQTVTGADGGWRPIAVEMFQAGHDFKELFDKPTIDPGWKYGAGLLFVEFLIHRDDVRFALLVRLVKEGRNLDECFQLSYEMSKDDLAEQCFGRRGAGLTTR